MCWSNRSAARIARDLSGIAPDFCKRAVLVPETFCSVAAFRDIPVGRCAGRNFSETDVCDAFRGEENGGSGINRGHAPTAHGAVTTQRRNDDTTDQLSVGLNRRLPGRDPEGRSVAAIWIATKTLASELPPL
jgi:hypothetical protein